MMVLYSVITNYIFNNIKIINNKKKISSVISFEIGLTVKRHIAEFEIDKEN